MYSNTLNWTGNAVPTSGVCLAISRIKVAQFFFTYSSESEAMYMF